MKRKQHYDFIHLTRDDREFIVHSSENYDQKELNGSTTSNKKEDFRYS